jgi:hypothetical protein
MHAPATPITTKPRPRRVTFVPSCPEAPPTLLPVLLQLFGVSAGGVIMPWMFGKPG